MPKKPIDLERVRRADADLAKLLEEHPDLCESNPERQQALEAWVHDTLQQEATDDGTQEDREEAR